MEIKLDGEAVAEIAAAAIFQSMSEDARNNVLKQAVQSLLLPENDRRMPGYGKTPLQRAFEQAVNGAAYRAIQEKMESDPELRAAIDNMLGPLILGLVKEESDKYDDSLADAIGRAIGLWLAEKSRES